MQRATGQTLKPDQFGKVRHNIARLKTVQREQQRRRRQVTHERREHQSGIQGRKPRAPAP